MSDQKTLNLLAKGAILVFLGSLMSKVFAYVFRALVARTAGPEAYGQLNLGLAVLGIATTISIMSLNKGLQKYIGESERDARDYVMSALNLSLPWGIFLGVVLFLSAEFIATNLFNSPDVAPVIKVLALVIPFHNLSRVSIATTVGFKTVKYRIITNQFFQNIVQILGAAAFLYLGYEAVGAAGGWLLGAVLSSFLALYYMETKFGPILFSREDYTPVYGKMIRFSAPLFMSGIIGSVLGWTDTMFLGYFLTDTDVGFYNAALPIALMIMVPFNALGSLALPSMSDLSNRSKKDVADTLKTLERWTAVLSVPGFVLLVLFSGPVLKLLFGSEYTVASTALIILSFGYLFNSTTGHLGDTLKAYEYTDLMFKNTMAKLLLNVPLNILLIPRYGIEGAAVATAASVLLVNSLLVLEAKYYLRMHPFSFDLAKPFLASLIPVGLIYFLLKRVFETVPVWALIPGVILFGILYLANLVLIGGLKEEDRPVVEGVGRRIGREEQFSKVMDKLVR